MPTRYFSKAILSMAAIVDGRAVDFEQLPGNNGVLALETGKDDTLIAALDRMAAEQVGGIERLTKEQYDEKKNLAQSMQFAQRKGAPQLRVMPTNSSRLTRSAMAAAANLADSAPANEAPTAAPDAPAGDPVVPHGTTEPAPSVVKESLTPAPAEPASALRPVTRRISRAKAEAAAPVTPAVPASV